MFVLSPITWYLIPHTPAVSSFPGVIDTIIGLVYTFSPAPFVPFILIVGSPGSTVSITNCLSLFRLVFPALSVAHALTVYFPSSPTSKYVDGTFASPFPSGVTSFPAPSIS